MCHTGNLRFFGVSPMPLKTFGGQSGWQEAVNVALSEEFRNIHGL